MNILSVLVAVALVSGVANSASPVVAVAPPPTSRTETAASYFITDHGRSVVSREQHRGGRHLTFARTALQCTSVERYVETFDSLADGTRLVSGSVLTMAQTLAGGLSVQARRFQRGSTGGFPDAMIFDTLRVTGNDFDLALDAEHRGNILIISATNDSSNADDAGQGGEIWLSFRDPVTVHAMTFIDVEDGVRVDFSGPTVELTFMIPPGMSQDGQVLKEFLNVAGVTRVQIQLGGSGAVDDIDFSICRQDIQGETQVEVGAPTVFPVEYPSVMPAKYLNPSIQVSNTIVAGTYDGDASACPGVSVFQGRLGDAITFCLTVKNTGDTLLAALTMVDPVLGVDDFRPLLRPGDSVTVTVPRIITAELASSPVTTVVATGVVVFADETPIPNIPTPQHVDEAEILLLPPEPTSAPVGSLPCEEDPVIDFETDGFGNPLGAGTVLTEDVVFAAHTTFFAKRSQAAGPEGNRAMLFDTAVPTGNDAPDLGLQPQQGNVVIISKDGNRNNPNDNAQGGLITATFGAGPVKVLELTVLDAEGGGRIEGWDDNGDLVGTVPIPMGTDGGLQTIKVDLEDVVELRIYVKESGALDDLTLWLACPV